MECPTDLTVVLVKYIYLLTEASCLGYEEMHKPGGGVLPHISHVGMCRPKGCDFWAFLA